MRYVSYVLKLAIMDVQIYTTDWFDEGGYNNLFSSGAGGDTFIFVTGAD